MLDGKWSSTLANHVHPLHGKVGTILHQHPYPMRRDEREIRSWSLTQTERRVLDALLMRSVGRREMASRMKMKVGTFKFHVSSIYRKAEVIDRPSLILKLYEEAKERK